jgi:hypothetical protein
MRLITSSKINIIKNVIITQEQGITWPKLAKA